MTVNEAGGINQIERNTKIGLVPLLQNVATLQWMCMCWMSLILFDSKFETQSFIGN